MASTANTRKEPTIITRGNLAERWGCTGVYIDKLTQNGVIHRLRDFPSPHYSLKEILQIEEGEGYKESVNERRLRLQLEEANEKIKRLENHIKNTASEGMLLINI